MATANPNRTRNRPRSARWRSRIGWLALACAAALLAFYWRPLRANALTGAAYGARVGCSCRFVAGRSLGDCRKDFEPGMGMVMLSEDAAARSVTARVPLLASQTATLREGAGCVLEPFTN